MIFTSGKSSNSPGIEFFLVSHIKNMNFTPVIPGIQFSTNNKTIVFIAHYWHVGDALQKSFLSQ